MKKGFVQIFIILSMVMILNWTAYAAVPSDATLYNKHYYKLYDKRGTWDEAKAYCESLGGHLVTITDEKEQAMIEGLLKDGDANCYWLGGCWNGSEYVWITGEAFVYTNWGLHQPAAENSIMYSPEEEPYLSIYRVENPWESSGNDLGKWNDVSETSGGDMYNSKTTGLICEWEPSSDSKTKSDDSGKSDKSDDPKKSGDTDDSYDNYTGEGDKPLTKDVETVDKTITTTKSEEVKGASFPLLQAKAVNVKYRMFKLKWNALPGATKYIVYGNRCGRKNKYEYITSTKKTYYKPRKLKKGKFYKYLVVAAKGDKVISVSKTVHVGLKNKPNPTKVKVNKKKVELILGSNKSVSTFRLKCSVKGTTLKQHRAICYETDNVNVARVSKKGLIKAIGVGTCNIYAYAQNGVFAKINVTVLK